MRAISLFFDNDSQYARGASGDYFARDWVVDCYGAHWSKWRNIGKLISATREKSEWQDNGGREFSRVEIAAHFQKIGCYAARHFYIPKNKGNASRLRLPNN